MTTLETIDEWKVTVTTWVTKILDKKADRRYAVICNNSAAVPLYISFEWTPVVWEWVMIWPSVCYEINNMNLLKYSVYWVAASSISVSYVDIYNSKTL